MIYQIFKNWVVVFTDAKRIFNEIYLTFLLKKKKKIAVTHKKALNKIEEKNICVQ